MMKRKKKAYKAGKSLLTAVLCVVLAAAFAACSAGSGGAGAGASSGAGKDQSGPAPETAVVRLALAPNGHIFNAIAEKEGYLEEEGIKVAYVSVENDTEVFEGLANGTIDVASNSGTNLPLQHISEGMDLTIFGGYLLTGCMPIFARVDTKWNGLGDLIGSTMACEPNLYAVTGPLLDMGYDPLKDITWLQTETQEERIAAVERGDADFGLVGTSLNYEIISNPNIKIIMYASDILPEYSCCRVEAPTQWVNENPNTVKALLKAWIRAMAYYDSHHNESVELVTRMTGQDEALIRAYADNPHFELNIDPMKSVVERAWNYMDRLGLLDEEAKKINIDDHINVDLYKQALDECQEQYGEENSAFYEKMQAQYSRNNM